MSDPAMKLFVWRGDGVLKRYSSGTVAVIAADLDAAWAKLKLGEPTAWVALQTGDSYVADPAEWGGPKQTPDELLAEVLADKVDLDSTFKLSRPEPEVFDLEDAPVIVQWGGE